MKINLKSVIKIVLLVTVCVSVFSIYACIVNETNVLAKADVRLFEIVERMRKNVFDNFFEITTFLGSAYVIIPITIVLVIIKKTRKDGILLGFNTVLVAIINFVVKRMYQRVRPNIFDMIENGFSFPSAHTAVSIVFYGYLCIIVSRSNISKKYKFLIQGILVLVSIITAFSRIYLGVHYLSDIGGGIILGISFLICSNYIHKIIQKLN